MGSLRAARAAASPPPPRTGDGSAALPPGTCAAVPARTLAARRAYAFHASLLAFLLFAFAGCALPQASWRAPARGGAAKAAVPPQASPLPAEDTAGERIHVVVEGDTLYRISQQYGVDLDELMDKNQIADARSLAVGRELALPPQRRSVTPVAAAPQGASSERSKPGAAQGRAGLARMPAEGGVAPAMLWPVKGVLYSRFGARGASRHDGIDISAPEGTPIAAAADGTVIYSGVQRGYGNLVILGHEGNLVTIYAHNRENLVKEGEKVRQGQVIAKVGRTGRATGPHLHFEVRKGTTPHDPIQFLPR